MKPLRYGTTSLAFALLVLILTSSIRAQENYTRIELGAQFSTIRQTPMGGGAQNFPGFGARFDWNFNRRLALETQMDFFPQHAAPVLLLQGGQTFQAVFGLRAKVVQTRKLSVFGLIRPGLFHFTDVLDPQVNADGSHLVGPRTYFEQNLGGGIEYYVSPRWVLRADISGNPYRVANESYATPNRQALAIGKIEDTTRLSFGVAYRPGVLLENEAETRIPGNWEVGPLFSSMTLVRDGAQNGVRTDLGLGGYASYRFYGPLYLDSDVLFFPADRASWGPHDGGQILQGLFGVKGGIRRNHVGFFGKARPGFHSYSQAITSVTIPTGGMQTYTFDRSTNFVLDLGGIVEFYPTAKSTLRIEAGDTHIFYGTRNVNVNGTIYSFPGDGLKHSIQIVVGYGWRF